MNRKRSFFYHKLLSCTLIALFLSIIECPFNPAPTQARPLGSPRGANRSNGVRGECFAADRERPLIALVDGSDPALTTQANPTFLFYLPYSRTPDPTRYDRHRGAIAAEFELLDENEDSVLKNKNQKIVFPLPNKPGIVKVTLPDTEARLEADKEYFWIFRIICDSNDDSANPSVAGWIKRVRVGSSENLWFDRLDQLAESRTNHLEQWTQLLDKFELEDLALQEIVELRPEEQSNIRRQANRAFSQPTSN